MRSPRSLVGIVLLLLALGAQRNAQADRILVEAKTSAEKRLSAELFVVTKADGEFFGLTKDNRAVLDVKPAAMAAVVQLATSVAVAPKEYELVNLLVSYEGEKPARETLEAAGLAPVDESKVGKFIVAKPEGGVTAAEINALLKDKAVIHVEPDYILSLPPIRSVKKLDAAKKATAQTPDDPLFPELWGMVNIHAPQGWNCITHAPKVVVAVIDTGVDYNHPDLAENMWKSADGKFGHDFFDDDDDPMDEHNHGTHCAGTIAAVGNNGVGVVGVAWKTKIMALRFLGPGGSGSTSDAISCIDWAIEHGAHVLSNSWGGRMASQELQDAITRAENKGVLFVAAAGNVPDNDNDLDPHYPSSYPNRNIVAVAAIDKSDAIAWFSCFGKQSVDIGAPGVGVLSTIRNNGYGNYDGTSMAAPHFAGALVLTWAKTYSSPKQDPVQMSEVRDLVMKSARPVPGLVDRWGHGPSAFVKGGVLDIAFLCNEVPPPPSCPVVASAQFHPDTVTVKDIQTIADVKIHLEVPSEVHLIANTSVTVSAPALFTTGFSDQSANHLWFPSLRWVQIKCAGDWVNFGSTTSVRLSAGDHHLRWNVWNIWAGPQTELKFDAGSMLVQAYPLKDTGSAVETVKSVKACELKCIKDAQGNAGITHPEGPPARSRVR